MINGMVWYLLGTLQVNAICFCPYTYVSLSNKSTNGLSDAAAAFKFGPLLLWLLI
jgi:hypothetical protein